MPEDFYVQSARVRMDKLEAERSRALADLAEAKSIGDHETASHAVQVLADVDAQAKNLASIHEQYVRSQNPPPPAEVSADERFARGWDRMDATDMLSIARQSKYAKDLDFNDPNFQAGMREVQRRRARGE